MEDEIKEILDRLFVYRNENDEMKYQPEDILTIEDVWLLLDYITNLQDTLKDREEYCYGLETRLDNLQEENELLTKARYSLDRVELERRINKAIEYIDNNSKGWDVDYDDNYYEWYTGFEEENIKELLNILGGDDNE